MQLIFSSFLGKKKEKKGLSEIQQLIILLLALCTQKDTKELHNSVTFPTALTTRDRKCKISF